LTRPNGVNTNYSYDSLSHLLSVLHQAGVNTLDGASYTYDPAGNRTAKTNYLNGITSNYTYDQLYELTQVTQGASTTESYSYDAVGNRLSSSGVPTYNYNSSNELTSNSTGSYTYDNNGNTLTDAGGKSYTWDFENRMSSAVVPGSGAATFKYDPFGRRIEKSSWLGTTNYFYDGANVLETTDQSGNELARYAQGVGVDEALSELLSGTASYYQQDGLGSATSLSSSAGAVANTYTYDSFGNITSSGGALANPFRYTGREFDPETGLGYYRARYYAPQLGRFVSEDPLRFGSGGTNFYGYVFQSPTNLADPLGLCPCSKPAPGPTPVPWADVDKNIHQAMETAANEPLDYSVPWFVMMVKKGGAWDYNSFYRPDSRTISDPFGNYNFGAVCNAMGYSMWQCQGGGGIAQYAQDVTNFLNGHGWQRTGSGSWPFVPPYGDRANDSELIRRGWEYAEWKRTCSTQ
jgi:RHS repeat-associated protein